MNVGNFPLLYNSIQVFIKHLHTDLAPKDIWAFFYNSSPNTRPIRGKNAQTISKANECFIYNGRFFDITFNSAISFEHQNNKFLHSYCLFFNCSSNKYGGAIYFCCNSSIVQYRSCCYKSQTNYGSGHNSYVELVEETDNKNFIYESSFNQCGKKEKSETNHLNHGKIVVKSINTSFCQAKWISGISFSNAIYSSCSAYSSFCNNTSDYIIIDITMCFDLKFDFCNVLKNSQSMVYQGTFNVNSHRALIENCSFFGNTGPNKEFYISSSASLSIKNSFCNRLEYNNHITTENVVTNQYFIHNLTHFSTFLCEADNSFSFSIFPEVATEMPAKLIFRIRRFRV